MLTLNRIGRLRHSKPHRQRVLAINDAKVTVVFCHGHDLLSSPREMMRDLGAWAAQNAKSLPKVLYKEFGRTPMGETQDFVGLEIRGNKVVLPAKHAGWDIRKATLEETAKLKRKAHNAQ